MSRATLYTRQLAYRRPAPVAQEDELREIVLALREKLKEQATEAQRLTGDVQRQATETTRLEAALARAEKAALAAPPPAPVAVPVAAPVPPPPPPPARIVAPPPPDVVTACGALLDALDKASPQLEAALRLLQMRGQAYRGPWWIAELDAAKTALRTTGWVPLVER